MHLNHQKEILYIDRTVFEVLCASLYADYSCLYVSFDATCLRRQLKKFVRKNDDFHWTYVPPITRLEFVEYVDPKISDATAYSQSKQAVMIPLKQRIVIGYSCKLMQWCVVIRHFDDVCALIDNLMP